MTTGMIYSINQQVILDNWIYNIQASFSSMR